MKANKALALAAAALIAAGAYYVTREKAPATTVENALLYPGLIDHLNDSRSIAIAGADGAFTLARDGERWSMTERDGYPARGELARTALVQLADLRIREQKTSKPENYAALGVTDDVAAGSETRRVTVRTGDGGVLADLIVGNVRQAKGLESPGHYVRRAGEPTALLVEGDLELATRRNDWMDTQVIDLPVERVRRVTITHPEKRPVVVSKTDPTQQLFALHEAPEGYEARSSAVTSSIGGLLLDVRFEDVAAVKRIEGLVPRTIIEVQTFDGLVATLEQYDVKDQNFIKFDFAFNPDLVFVSPAAAAATQPDAAKPPAPVPTIKPANEVQAEIEALTKKTAPWVYALADYKVRIIDKKIEDLIKSKTPSTPTPEPIERMGKEAP